MIELNSTNKIEEYKQEFDEHGVVRVFDFLTESSATQLSQHVANDVLYKNAFSLNNENKEASDEEISNLQPQQRRELYQAIYQLAGQGVGFLYGRNSVSANADKLIQQIHQQLNSENCVSLIKQISGNDKISYADGQVTRYRVGDFLTRHSDNIPGETRQIAYVLGLSPIWHPDWGGLLQFFLKDGTPQMSYAPVYNSLTLFDVNKVHSVTAVAPFSPQSRYSITGWFRE